MDSTQEYYAAKAALDWQIELGATEAICDEPVNRFEVPDSLPKPKPAVVAPVSDRVVPVESDVDTAAAARSAVSGVSDLDALKAALASFDLCELKRGARNLVFADGNPAARVMVIGEAPGREEDLAGKPFVGPAGQLLDKMFAAIGLSREASEADQAIYITNVLPWRPPQNREPTPDEIAMMLPFLQKHVELVKPDLLVLMGNISCQAVLGRKGITRMRGKWESAYDLPVMPMFHPAYLLRNPAAKREAWNDLLMVQARMRDAK